MRARFLLGSVLPVALACGGLVPADEVLPAPEPEVVDAEPPTPESLFAALDPAEAPPFEGAKVPCPKGTLQIRHPFARGLEIYCADGSGTRVGPYSVWKGSVLREAGTYEGGVLQGAYTRWERDDEGALRKVEEQVFVDGRPDGDLARWDVDGNLLVRGTVVGGKRQGRFLENAVEDGEIVFSGACFDADAEVWRTSSAEEFVTRDCSGAPDVSG